MKDAYIVTGPLRSGTSCMTCLLEAYGFDIGRNVRVLRESPPMNPQGHFEADLLFAINRRLLTEAGAGSILEASPPERLAALMLERYFRLFLGKFDGELCKDPLLCFTLGGWRQHCPCCDQSIKLTPAPARIIPKGLLTDAALAWVVTSKYQDALPLYRQAALLGRFGGDLSRNTLAASVVRVGEAVQPIINLLRDHVLEADIVYGGETTVQVLKEPGRAAQTKSYLWAQMNGTGPPMRLFSYQACIAT